MITTATCVDRGSGNIDANGRTTSEFLVPILNVIALLEAISSLNNLPRDFDTHGMISRNKI
jgi:hypothetical protein